MGSNLNNGGFGINDEQNNVQKDLNQTNGGFNSFNNNDINRGPSTNGGSINNQLNKGNNNSKLMIIIICLVAIIVVVVGAVLCILSLKAKNNSKIVFASKLGKYAENLKLKEMQDIYSILIDGFTYKLTGDVDVNYNDSEIFKGTIKMDIIDNPNTKQQYLNFSITDKDNKTLALDTLIKDNKMYLNVKDVFDKYYYTDFEYIKIFYKYDNFKNNLLNSFKSYFNEDKLVETKTSLKVNNKSIEVNKVSITLTEKDMNELYILIMQNLLNDEKALQEIVDLKIDEELTLSDLKEDLKDEIDYYKEELDFYDDEVLFGYTMYMKPSTIFKNGEILKQEIIYEDGKILIEGDESGTFKVLDTYNEEVLFTGTFDKDSIKFNYESEEDDLYLDATLTKEALTINMHDKNNKNYINMNYKFTNKYEKDSFKGIYDFKVDMNVDGIKVKATVFLNLGINKSSKIPEIKINNAKDFSDINEEESTNILNKIYELPIISEVLEGLYSYDYEFDYNYDSEDDYDVSSFEEIVATEIASKTNGTKQVIYIGREACSFCETFLPVLLDAQKNFNYTTLYIDFDKIYADETSYNYLKNMTGKGYEDFMTKNFGLTPIVLIVENSKIIGAQVGSSNYDAFKKVLEKAGY